MFTSKIFALLVLIHAIYAAATNTTLVAAGNTTLVKRDDRINFNYVLGAVGVIGYAHGWGATEMRGVMTHCVGQREGRRWYNADCVYHSIKAASGTALFYILFGAPEMVATALLQRFTNIYNTVGFRKRDGDASFSEDTEELFGYNKTFNITANVDAAPPSLFEGLTQAELDNYLQIFAGSPQSNLTLSKRGCTGNDMRTDSQWFDYYDGNYGVKTQCKPGCDMRHINWGDTYAAIDKATYEMDRNSRLNVQYTLFHSSSRRVFMRCFTTMQTNAADVCPEGITGSSCYV
jgi:hypothetical protein